MTDGAPAPEIAPEAASATVNALEVPFDARRVASCAAVIATAAIFGLTYGLTAPLIALDLESHGMRETWIGVNAAMQAVGVLVVAPLLPKLTGRFGARRLVVAALVGSAAFLALFALTKRVWLFFPLRFALGAASEILFVVSETWTNELATDRVRGRVMAAYMAAQSLGFAGGPIVLSLVKSHSVAYTVGAAFCALAILPIAWRSVITPPPLHDTDGNPLTYARIARIAIAAAILNAAVETAGLSFLVLYASGVGWPEVRGMRLVSTLLFGAIVCQLPIGWLADHTNPRRLALVLAVLSALGAGLWPFVFAFPVWTFAAIFVWGGIFVGLYTVMLTIIGTRFSGSQLVGVYAALSLAWGVGALVGPTVVGVAMEASPRFGLPLAVSIGCALFATFLAFTKSET